MLCNECEELYCRSCYDTNHAKGKRAVHTHLNSIPCIECDYQVASHFCEQCGDAFCANCYYVKHQLGRLRLHKWTGLVPLCPECPQRVRTEAIGKSSDPNSSSYYILGENRETMGPYLMSSIAYWLHSGKLTSSDLVCKEGSSQWITIREAGIARAGLPQNPEGDENVHGSSSLQLETFPSRLYCQDHQTEICNMCFKFAHSSCSVSELPFRNDEAVKEQERLKRELEEKEKKRILAHEMKLKVKRQKNASANRIQMWWRGCKGREWGMSYMAKIRSEREMRFIQARQQWLQKQKIRSKIFSCMKSFARAPCLCLKMLRGPKRTAEEEKLFQQAKAEKAIIKFLDNEFSRKLKGSAILESGSKEILLSSEWLDETVMDKGGTRKISRRDRLRFQVGLELLGGEDFENFEFSVEEVNSENRRLLLVNKEVVTQLDDEPNILVWWMPPLTEEEIERRHRRSSLRRKREQQKAAKSARRQARLANLADRFDDESWIGKRLKRMSGQNDTFLVEEEDEINEDDDEEDEESSDGEI